MAINVLQSTESHLHKSMSTTNLELLLIASFLPQNRHSTDKHVTQYYERNILKSQGSAYDIKHST